MKKFPLTVILTLILIGLMILAWCVFGIILAATVQPALPIEPKARTGMAILSFTIAALLITSLILLIKHHRSGYFLTLAFFVLFSALTILDEFGLPDLIFLLLCLIPILLLIKDRAWYLQTSKSSPGLQSPDS